MAYDSVRWSISRRPGRGGAVQYEGEILIPGDWSRVLTERGTPMFPQAPRGQSMLAVKSAPANHPTLAPASAGGALQQAGSLASSIMSNPLVQAALPPGSGVAVEAIKYLADSDVAGDLASAAKNIVGEGAKRIADALKFW